MLWVVKAAGAWGWQPYHLQVPIVLKPGSLTLLEPSGPVEACNGIALPFVPCNIDLKYYIQSVKSETASVHEFGNASFLG
jgi:hypothetical protein